MTKLIFSFLNRIRFICFCFTFCISINNYYAQQFLKWEVKHPKTSVWMEAGSHTSVQELLWMRGELPDPFYGENEKKYLWVEDEIWEWRSTFQVKIKESEFIDIVFPWIDTYASIYLNDSLLIKTENSFHPYRISVKNRLKIGENKLHIVFVSPIAFHKNKKTKKDVFYPAPNDVGSFQVAPLTRKPQYQFGWDWALRMNTIGIIKPVEIQYYNKNKLVLAKVETALLSQDLEIASLAVSLYFVNNISNALVIKSKLFGETKLLNSNSNRLKWNVIMNHPKCWWPRDQGEQFMYSDTISVYTEDGVLIDEKVISFGVRFSELIQEKDGVGTSYYFKINHRPIFCKGANYIPQELFPSKVKPTDIKWMVEQMEMSNFNCVRVWGGGYYPDDYFYELCDRKGIMVWQDLMFACAMYPGDTDFLNSVRTELEYQIPRMTAHPSVILINGNNEVDVAWKYWGFQVRYMISPSKQKIIRKAYNSLFKGLAPEVCNTNSYVPYIHTSPLGHWVFDKDFNHGTQHYWGVWHGRDPIEDFGRKFGRFNAEYGFQSFPEMNTVKTFSTDSDWSLDSPVMKHHQKSYVGNGMIKKHADLLYGETNDFKEFIYRSQLTQAKAVGIAIASHRLNAPVCMGTIYWQLNDCWPAPTWSSIDYNKNWKALQYQVRDDYRSLTILQKTEQLGKETYWICSDLPAAQKVKVNVSVHDFSGNRIGYNSKLFDVKSMSSIPLHKMVNMDSLSSKNYFLEIELKELDSLGVEYKLNTSNLFRDEYSKQNSIKRGFVHIGDKSSYKKADSLDFVVSIKEINHDLNTATIEITSKKFLQNVWINSVNNEVDFTENFKSILPGKIIRLTAKFKQGVDFSKTKLELYWM